MITFPYKFIFLPNIHFFQKIKRIYFPPSLFFSKANKFKDNKHRQLKNDKNPYANRQPALLLVSPSQKTFKKTFNLVFRLFRQLSWTFSWIWSNVLYIKHEKGKRERKNESRRKKYALGTVLKLFMNNSILTILTIPSWK